MTLVRRIVALGAVSILILPAFSFGQEATSTPADAPDNETRLRNLIEARTEAIKDLETQIGAYQEQLKQIDGQKKSLQNQIKSFDITRKKLSADISITEEKIDRTNYQLEALALDIRDKETHIGADRSAIAEGLRILNDYDQRSMVESMLDSSEITDIWNDVDTIANVQNGVHTRITELSSMRDALEDKQADSQKIKDQLVALRLQLSNQKKVVEYNTKQKNALLTSTKNNEANYQKLLKEKTALRDSFQQELLGFESELKLITSQSQIPQAVHGMLSWPLDSIVVTQPFGDTAFARDHAQVYNGHGHNGVDFRASLGTPVKSAAGGIVTGSGNTDLVCPGASYGKWVLVRHENGLSTLYAHLSVISVVEGEAVGPGSTLGYSGDSGYATGPHLHFTVYASQGVEVVNRQSRVCGGTYRMPIADLRAYLDPLAYLPELQ